MTSPEVKGHTPARGAESPEVATLKQARHFVAIILSIGPDMPARHRWRGLHELAVQMNDRLNAAIPAHQFPEGFDGDNRSDWLGRSIDAIDAMDDAAPNTGERHG